MKVVQDTVRVAVTSSCNMCFNY